MLSGPGKAIGEPLQKNIADAVRVCGPDRTNDGWCKKQSGQPQRSAGLPIRGQG